MHRVGLAGDVAANADLDGELMRLIQVPHTHVDQAWRDGASSLADACARVEEVTPSQLKLMLARNEYQLLAMLDGQRPKAWAAVCVQQLPNLRALFIYSIWAPGATGAEAMEQLMEYAKHNGCSVIRGACDDAVARLWERRFAAKKIYQIIEVAIT